MFGKTKYGLEFMQRRQKGRLHFADRYYFDFGKPDDVENFDKCRKEGLASVRDDLEGMIKNEKGSGEYLILFFREKRKRSGAIKRKKTLDRLAVEV